MQCLSGDRNLLTQPGNIVLARHFRIAHEGRADHFTVCHFIMTSCTIVKEIIDLGTLGTLAYKYIINQVFQVRNVDKLVSIIVFACHFFVKIVSIL